MADKNFKATIYKILLPDNTSYVGQTMNHVYERWGAHLSDLRSGIHNNKGLIEAYNKYGTDEWQFHVLEVLDTDDKAYVNLMEQHYTKLTPNTLNEREKHVDKKARDKHYKEYRNKKSLEWYYRNREARLEYWHKVGSKKRLEKKSNEAS